MININKVNEIINVATNRRNITPTVQEWDLSEPFPTVDKNIEKYNKLLLDLVELLNNNERAELCALMELGKSNRVDKTFSVKDEWELNLNLAKEDLPSPQEICRKSPLNQYLSDGLRILKLS